MFKFKDLFRHKVTLADDNAGRSAGVMKGELTITQKIIGEYFKYLNNPDTILKTKSQGKQLSVLYDAMIDSDAHLASLIQTRKLALLGLQYRIEPFIDALNGATEATERDKQIAQDVAWAISQMKKFRTFLMSSLSAFDHGYSISEIIWEYMNAKYVPGRIKHRRPEYFIFDIDENLFFIAGYGKGEQMPRDKFVVLSHNEKYSDPYGNGLCKAAYWACWFKTTLIKYMLTFSEKLGMPTVDGAYPAGTWDQTKKDEFLAQLNAIQNNSCIIHPDDTTVGLLETAARKEADFITALEFFNAEESKIILGQTLTSEQGKVGSLSLGRVHNEVRLDILQADAEWLSDGLTDNLIGSIVKANYGPNVNWPKFKLIIPRQKDLLNDSTTVKNLVSVGLEIGEKYTREHFEIPAPEAGEKILSIAQSPVPGFPASDNLGFSERHNHKARLAYKTQRPPGAKTYDKLLLSSYRDQLYEFLIGIFGDVKKYMLVNLSPGQPIAGLIDQAVREIMSRGNFNSGMARNISDAAFSIAKNMAQKFSANLSGQSFYDLANRYMTERFYQKGTIQGIADTFRGLLKGAISEWDNPAINYDIGKMKSLLQSTFESMSEFKAQQIAQNEIKQAANYASFEIIDKARLSESVEAYFITDPASCDICQDWASRNPYTYQEALSMGLPHIGCDDQWSFTLKGEPENE